MELQDLAFPLEPAVAYRVREVLPNRTFQTTADPPPLTFTRGETFSHVDFGIASGRRLSSSMAPSSSVDTDPGAGPGPLDSQAGVVDVVRALG